MNKNKFHILVVDDDDRIRELVKEYLAENNFLVTTAKDVCGEIFVEKIGIPPEAEIDVL